MKPIVRKATPNDLKYIISTWLKSNRNGVHPIARKSGYYDSLKTSILQEAVPHGLQCVLCYPDDPTTILGWISGDISKKKLIVHYVYIRAEHRELHYATQLLCHLVEEHDRVSLGLETVVEYRGRKGPTEEEKELFYIQKEAVKPDIFFCFAPQSWQRSLIRRNKLYDLVPDYLFYMGHHPVDHDPTE